MVLIVHMASRSSSYSKPLGTLYRGYIFPSVEVMFDDFHCAPFKAYFY